jgi:PucR C-terminal helix-turn-helix domain/GAF domain/GGDEF-like domain
MAAMRTLDTIGISARGHRTVSSRPALLDENVVNGLLTAEQFPAEFDESVDNATLYAEYRRLAAEQAALRRLASLVARGVEPSEVFEAVTDEMRRCVQATRAALLRYESNGEVTFVGAACDSDTPPKSPVNTRFPIGTASLAAVVRRTGQAARLDTYENVAGASAARGRAEGVSAAVAVPVIVDGDVWGLVVVTSTRPVPMPADTEARISRFVELVAGSVVAGYRDEQKRQLFDEVSRRPLLIDSLLVGRVVGEWSSWEVANHLRLPIRGPFVVIAAGVSAVGNEALPGVESKLRSLDAYSAWRLLPDLHVGIVHIQSPLHLEKVLDLVSRLAVGPVGVSARYTDLRDTPQALHFAKVMLRSRRKRSKSVAMFDGSILAAAAVSAPEVMVKSAGVVLAGFGDLPDEEREILFETFRVWQDSDTSVGGAAEVLFCHPNTVRHRLRRIEKLTGRSLSRTRDVVELSLALEVHLRLM